MVVARASASRIGRSSGSPRRSASTTAHASHSLKVMRRLYRHRKTSVARRSRFPCTLDVRMRHTKIVATLGPASSSDVVLAELLAAGVDVVRLNFSHGTHDSHGETVRRVRAAA